MSSFLKHYSPVYDNVKLDSSVRVISYLEIPSGSRDFFNAKIKYANFGLNPNEELMRIHRAGWNPRDLRLTIKTWESPCAYCMHSQPGLHLATHPDTVTIVYPCGHFEHLTCAESRVAPEDIYFSELLCPLGCRARNASFYLYISQMSLCYDPEPGRTFCCFCGFDAYNFEEAVGQLRGCNHYFHRSCFNLYAFRHPTSPDFKLVNAWQCFRPEHCLACERHGLPDVDRDPSPYANYQCFRQF